MDVFDWVQIGAEVSGGGSMLGYVVKVGREVRRQRKERDKALGLIESYETDVKAHTTNLEIEQDLVAHFTEVVEGLREQDAARDRQVEAAKSYASKTSPFGEPIWEATSYIQDSYYDSGRYGLQARLREAEADLRMHTKQAENYRTYINNARRAATTQALRAVTADEAARKAWALIAHWVKRKHMDRQAKRKEVDQGLDQARVLVMTDTYNRLEALDAAKHGREPMLLTPGEGLLSIEGTVPALAIEAPKKRSALRDLVPDVHRKRKKGQVFTITGETYFSPHHGPYPLPVGSEVVMEKPLWVGGASLVKPVGAGLATLPFSVANCDLKRVKRDRVGETADEMLLDIAARKLTARDVHGDGRRPAINGKVTVTSYGTSSKTSFPAKDALDLDCIPRKDMTDEERIAFLDQVIADLDALLADELADEEG